jgi:hypothetical protein
VLLKWCAQLLADRDERRAVEQRERSALTPLPPSPKTDTPRGGFSAIDDGT